MENKVTYDPSKLDEATAELVKNLLQRKGAIEEPELPKKYLSWKPIDGDVYYVISSDGSGIVKDVWAHTPFDENRYVFGNYFRTKEEAEFMLEKLKIATELQRFADEHNAESINWHDEKQKKYLIQYSLATDCLSVGVWSYIQPSGVCFISQEIAEAAIKSTGENRLKKYYFGSYKEMGYQYI